MSTLTVVRHGQARPFEKDSDRLSEVGELQAQALAEYWDRAGITFDEVLCGTLQRQSHTAALAVKRAPEISPDWNEYDAHGVMRHHAPAFEHEGSGPERNRRFQKVLEAAMLAWLETPAQVNGVEPWSVFRERVRRGLRRIQEGPSNRRVVLFTSGGPIGILVQTALGAPDPSFLEINWRVRNCSITEFVFSRDRLSLDSFNATPHLSTGALRTFR
jgi:broad specificity phosphatase PhoE